jgi:predicted nucleotidyltransferase
MPESSFDELIEAMKAGAGILQDAGVPFVLGGGLSAWARGGPRSEHDVDFLLKPEDAETARDAFESAGWRTEKPPEGWLYKVWHDNGALVDLIFNPASGPITQELIERSPEAEVMALRIHVSTLEDVMVAKLLALTEQEPDFSAALEWARALREQIDWDDVRARTEASPFAKAFFTLVEGLGVVEPALVSDTRQGV